jgi:type IV pilus assembly protein PilA
MLHTLKARQAARTTGPDGDQGFTLIELMVVVLIIAILLAIAIPTFLGAQNKAKDRSSQSSARNALTAAKNIYADTQSYVGATVAEMTPVEPSLTFVANNAPSTKAREVSIAGTDTTFWAAVKSSTGSCFYIREVSAAPGGTSFNKGDSSATCTADAAQALTTGWSDAW